MKKKIILIMLLIIIIDIIIKLLIDHNLELTKNIPIINNFFTLSKVYNTGASWSILAGQQILLIIITFILLGILWTYQKKFVMHNRNIVTFGLLYGGIIGNLIDRICNGYVIDYLDFQIFSYDFPVFNFADICIVLGVFLLIIAIYKKEDKDANNS